MGVQILLQLATNDTSGHATNGELCMRSGTTIQKDVWTTPTLSSKISPSFHLVYNHCLLKIANEAVVDGMRKVVGKQADKGIGLHFGRCVFCIFVTLMSMHTYAFLTLYHFCVLACMQMRHAYRGMRPCNMKLTTSSRSPLTTTSMVTNGTSIPPTSKIDPLLVLRPR